MSAETLELAILSPLPSSSRTSGIISNVTLPEPSLAHYEPGQSTTTVDDSRASSAAGSATITSYSLAPVDRGFGAWSFLTAAFFVAGIVWGFPSSFGVFLDAYLDANSSQYAKQKGAASLLPLIGPLSSGIMYLSGIVIHPVLTRYPSYRQTSHVFGAALCFASLFGASYARKVTELVALQGALYAIGGSLLYAPCVSYTSEWFVARRGLANGIVFTGTAIGGAVQPLVLSQLIQKYGPMVSLRILAIAVTCFLVPFLPFLKPRIPISRVSGPVARSSDRSWLKSKAFWFILIVNTLQGFGYFLPILWLPTFATDLKLGSTESSIVLAMLNAASCIGRTGMGALADKFDPWFLGLSNLTFSALATFVLWGVLAHTYAGLLAFSIAYGILAGGWSSLWSGFTRPIAKDDPFLATTLFSYLLCSRGIGNILSTPISTELVRSGAGWTKGKDMGFNVGDGRFEGVIVFVGSCFAGAAVVSLVGWVLELGVRRRR